MEFYKRSNKNWKLLSTTGDAEKFSREYSFLKHYADRLSLNGCFGDTRYVIIEEGKKLSAFRIPDETKDDPHRAYGLRTFKETKTTDILNEFGLYE